jgi:hypothetical protein
MSGGRGGRGGGDVVGIQITQKVQQSRIYSRLVEECREGYKNAREYGDTANIKAMEWIGG